MKYLHLFLVLIIVLLFLSCQRDKTPLIPKAGDEVKPPPAPIAKYVWSISIDGNDNIYLGTIHGVFISTNKGADWITANHGLEMPISAVTRLDNNVIYAGTYGGLYHSSNQGQEWQKFDLPYFNASAILISRFGFIFTAGWGVFRSADNGETWDWQHFTRTPVISFAEDDSGYIYCGTEGTDVLSFAGGVYYSPDNGETWNQTGLKSISSIKALVTKNNDIFAGTSNGILYSTDRGVSWSEPLLERTYVFSLLFKGTNQLFAGIDDGILISNDMGVTWESGGLDTSCICLAMDSAGQLYAGTDLGLFRSADDGLNWTLVIDDFTSN
jgi:ligand-binding sensor domain-containing protein